MIFIAKKILMLKKAVNLMMSDEFSKKKQKRKMEQINKQIFESLITNAIVYMQ